MFSKKLLHTAVFVLILITAAACANHPASDTVKAFTIALADSAWQDAWQMLSPGTQAAWDSTAAVFRRFGYAESAEFLSTLSTPVTEEEFQNLDGEMLFSRMAATAPELTDLSRSVKAVELPDSTTALVTIATSDGDQVIPVRLCNGKWLIDLTTFTPPPESNEEAEE